MSGFTTGPWAWDGNVRIDAPRIDGEPPTENMVALVYSSRDGSLEANARLIAAAPDLLAALEACPLPSTMGTAEAHYRLFYAWYNEHALPAIAKVTQP